MEHQDPQPAAINPPQRPIGARAPLLGVQRLNAIPFFSNISSN